MKKELQRNVNGVTSGGGSIQHPLSIHSASIGSRWKLGGIQVLLTLVILFTLGIGQMWGDTTYNLIEGGSLNTDHFSTAGTLKNADSNHLSKKGVGFGSSGYTTLTSIQKTDRFIRYDCKTDDVTISVEAVNGNSSTNKNFTIFVVSEDGTLKYTKTTSIATKKTAGSDSYHVTDPNASLYVSTNSTDVWVTQITVTESGNSNKRGGQAGYALNLNKGRFAGTSGVANLFDGMTIIPSSDYTLGTSEYLRFKSKSIAFNISERVAVALTATNEKKVIIAQNSTATTPEYTSVANGTIKKTLGKTGDWYILGKEDIYLTKLEFIPVYTITYAANGGGGSMNATNDTVGYQGETMEIPACTFTAPSGYEFDGWEVTGVVGKTELDDEGSFSMPNNVVTLTAQWKEASAKYTVIYKDGTTELKNVMVNVGSAPAAYSPTKDFYTFTAWQKDAVDYDPADLATDAAANATITLTARWTAQYTSGTYEFTGNLTMGTDPQMTIENNTSGKGYSAGRIDNIYVDAQTIGYEATGDYGGWKLKSQNKGMRFLVENASGIRVTLGEANPLRIEYTEGGVAKSADIAKSTTSSVYKADANTIVRLTNATTGTVTLKKIEILPLYNATYTDGKGDASGSASNVTEVTLPTPSETTVGGYSFTGWVANQTVYDGETPKTTGEALNAGGTYTLTATTTFTAQWQLISDFDVKFFRGYGDPDVQIGETQSISTGGYAVAPTDPVRDGYRFLGWSTDGTEANIVTVASYVISVATDFTAVWIQQFEVTFDGAGAVSVDNGATVASPDSPTQAGKIFQGWYNGESKYDFSAAVTDNLALESKWAVADPNHYVYAYNDDFHFDGVVYKTPEGKTTDPDASEATLDMTTPYTLFSGAEGITSIVATKAVYDYKKGDNTKHITAYLKLKKSSDDANSKLIFTIASGYTAVLKVKMGGYSKTPTVTLKKGDDAVTGTPAAVSGKAEDKDYAEITYNLVTGVYEMTTADQTLYFSHIDLQATALPAHSVTYKPGDGEGAWVVDADATEVADCPGTFTAPDGKVFNGWKNESDDSDVAVGAIVEDDMNLIAQWINHYAVTFNMNGHGDAIDPQDIKEGAKATRPDDPVEIGYDFGGWFTDNGTFEVPFDFNTAITAATPLYAKWTAFGGCTLLVPATSGDAPAVGDPISMQSGSKGGSMSVIGTPLSYNTYGLGFDSNSSAKAKVTINNEIQEGTVISLTLVANGTSSPRGLHLYTGDGATKITSLGWTSDMVKYTEETYTYTVQSTDVALIGTNEFQLWRNSSVFLKQLTVTNCGDPVIFHNLTSEIAPDHDPAYATVTLGASSVREGYTTTATYSDIDAAYEFDEWQISGTGASIEDASANPAVITMGTADAVVTLKLKAETPKHTVSFNKMGKGDDIASKLVAEGALVEEPTVTEPEGWILEGWYKENTLENKWDFASDVMGTSNIELFANWIADPSIKLIVDDTPSGKKINSEAYYTGAPLTNVTISAVEYPCIKLAGGATAATAPYGAGQNDDRVIAYCATTTATKIQVIAYSNSSSARPYTISFVEEGQTAAEADDNNVIVNLPTDGKIDTTGWYQFNSTKNRTIYITIPGNNSNYHFLQVKVIESGTAIKKAGQQGYSMNFNVGRPIGKKQVLHSNFEGFDFYANNDYKVLQSTSMVISNATNDYIKFHAAAPMTLAVTTENANSFYVTKAAKGTDNETLSTAGGTSYIDLDAAADWYISPKNGDVKIQAIAFIAPQCEQPTITPMSNSDLCEGDDFAALAVSASVSDGGTLHYQWYKHPTTGDDEAVGTDAASYTPEADGQYYVVVTNRLADHSDNSATSNTITVKHFGAAAITTAPLNQRGEVGDVVTLSAAATGKNVAYKWYTCDEDGSNEVALDPAQTGTSIDVTITAGLLQWYKVKVTSDCGGAEAKAKVSEFVPTTPANVTTSILWDWTSSAWPASGEVQFTNKTEDGTDLTPAYELLADADAIVPNNAAFRSDMLYGKGQWVWRSGNKFFQGTAIKFNTTVAGKVRVNYRSTGNNKEVQVTIAGTPAGKNKTSNFQWSEYVEVPAGDVEIICLSTDAEKSLTRVQKIEFMALAHQRTSGYAAGDLGTVCLEDATIIDGANLYELAGLDQYGYMAFDQILSGELEAGKPYLFEVTNPSKISFYKPVDAAHSDDEIAVKGMIGTFEGTTLYQNVAQNYYYFSGRHIWRVNDFTVEIPIPAHRCYVDMDALKNAVASPSPLPGRRRVTLGVNGKNAPTAIDNAEATEAPRKVMINGNLYILRGEKMYDATGRLVK